MLLVSAILFVISSSLDSLIVGIAYGIKKLKIGLLSNIIVAVTASAGTLISMIFGKFVLSFLPMSSASFIGSAVLISFGLYFILEPIIKKRHSQNLIQNKDSKHVHYDDILDNPEIADKDNSGYIDLKESITLAFALTINNVGLGIGAGIAGLDLTVTTLVTLFFSLTAIPLGYYLGNRFLSKFLGKYASIISGCIIILLGLYGVITQ
ncbi:MAG: sporulation membrane protein YtaF [Bacillota bacterium]|nr:sporulation membrane protein YtaF [Bacillota bacterium]